MKILAYLLTYSAIVMAAHVTAAYAQGAVTDLIKPTSINQIDRFMDAIRSSVPLIVPQENQSQQVRGDISGLWAGSITKVTSDFGPITLKFRPKTAALLEQGATGDSSGESLLENFQVVISQHGARVVVQHSEVENKHNLDGVHAYIDKLQDPTRTSFVRGRKQSGMYISIPIAQDYASGWGVYICPREFSYGVGVHGRVIDLKPSSYELSEASFEAEAKADGALATAGQKGRVIVNMEISAGLPTSDIVRDDAISTLPRATVIYIPKTKFEPFRFAPFNDVQQGVVSLVEMHTKAGYIRRQYFSHLRYLHKSEEPSPVNLVINRLRVERDTGECYILLEQRYSWTTYDKQAPPFQ